LTLTTLEMALKRRCPVIALLHHSDQGSYAAAFEWQAAMTPVRMANYRVTKMPLAGVYPHCIQKIEKRGRRLPPRKSPRRRALAPHHRSARQ